MNELAREIMVELLPTIINFIMIVIMGIVTSAFKRWVKNSEVKGLVADVVKFVEQTNKELHGEEKLITAELQVEKLLASKGIKTYISNDELRTLIEAAVYEMNSALSNDIKSGGGE